MAVDLDVLRNHPGRNPVYERTLMARAAAQKHNRDNPLMPLSVPKLPSKYVPHQGARETARRNKITAE